MEKRHGEDDGQRDGDERHRRPCEAEAAGRGEVCIWGRMRRQREAWLPRPRERRCATPWALRLPAGA
ncbi:MAG: hypothetical protein ACLSDQ_09705 [Adlercreutzia equolifaciens]